MLISCANLLVQLARAMETIGVTLSQAEAQFLVNEIDADGNGQVSFEEFAAYVLAFDEHDDHH